MLLSQFLMTFCLQLVPTVCSKAGEGLAVVFETTLARVAREGAPVLQVGPSSGRWAGGDSFLPNVEPCTNRIPFRSHSIPKAPDQSDVRRTDSVPHGCHRRIRRNNFPRLAPSPARCARTCRRPKAKCVFWRIFLPLRLRVSLRRGSVSQWCTIRHALRKQYVSWGILNIGTSRKLVAWKVSFRRAN